VLSLLAAYFLVSPAQPAARALAQAAARSQGEDTGTDPRSGPEEIRTLSQRFNQMSKDLARLDADRALILAGVFARLRTPLLPD